MAIRHLIRIISHHPLLPRSKSPGCANNSSVPRRRLRQRSSSRCTYGRRRPTSGLNIFRDNRPSIHLWRQRTRMPPRTSMMMHMSKLMTATNRTPPRRRRSINRRSHGGVAHTRIPGHTRYSLRSCPFCSHLRPHLRHVVLSVVLFELCVTYKCVCLLLLPGMDRICSSDGCRRCRWTVHDVLFRFIYHCVCICICIFLSFRRLHSWALATTSCHFPPRSFAFYFVRILFRSRTSLLT